jgi:hypothetical protein
MGSLAGWHSWVLVGHQGGFEEPSSAPFILSPFHLKTPLIHPIALVWPLGGPPGYILSCGKKGLKAQEVKAAGKR